MTKKIFVNLPVQDLLKAKAFYEAIGATNNLQFSDGTAACMVFSESIHVMLLTHAKWATFTKKPISNAHQVNEVILALTCESRDAVNVTADAAAKHGGVANVNPPQDHGFMFSRSIADPDGHIWEPFWMDTSSMPASS